MGASFALFPIRISLPRNGVRVGLRNALFEDCSAFTHVTACTLAESPKVIRYIEGFSHFVTSRTAPIATGWSKSCRVGLAPTEKRRLNTAHAKSGHSCTQKTLFQTSVDESIPVLIYQAFHGDYRNVKRVSLPLRRPWHGPSGL